MKSEVYFVPSRSPDLETRLTALKTLLFNMAPSFAFWDGEIVPVKITIGDSASTRHMHPELVKTVVYEIKKRSGNPFCFDTGVIYRGQRQNAVDHMTLAQNKGFGHNRIGAPFIVADGMFGLDGTDYRLESGNIKKIRLPSFIGNLERLVVLSHVTGHILQRYAGAIKNVAMGMACRPTKQVQHSSVKPKITASRCTACGCCLALCPTHAIAMKDNNAVIDQTICLGCGECLCACKFNAIEANWHEDLSTFGRRMIDVASFILGKFKQRLFINFAFDITKECDCISDKDDILVSRDVGILASTDILSLDLATRQMVVQNGGEAYFNHDNGLSDRFFDYARQKGLGSTDYKIVSL